LAPAPPQTIPQKFFTPPPPPPSPLFLSLRLNSESFAGQRPTLLPPPPPAQLRLSSSSPHDVAVDVSSRRALPPPSPLSLQGRLERVVVAGTACIALCVTPASSPAFFLQLPHPQALPLLLLPRAAEITSSSIKRTTPSADHSPPLKSSPAPAPRAPPTTPSLRTCCQRRRSAWETCAVFVARQAPTSCSPPPPPPPPPLLRISTINPVLCTSTCKASALVLASLRLRASAA
jgi:hypothetical protein